MKKWIKKNGVTAVLAIFLALMIFSPDAKAWFLRQLASTGIMNSSVKDRPTESAAVHNFTLKDDSGKHIDLQSNRGKVIFINFWASWCPPCRAEFPSVQKFYDQYKSNPGLVFLTLNLDDDPQLGRNYLQKGSYSIPFLVPVSSIPAEIYNGSLPTTVILDKEGKIRLYHTGVGDYSTSGFYKQIDALLAE